MTINLRDSLGFAFLEQEVSVSTTVSGFFVDAGNQTHLLSLMHKLSPLFPPVCGF